MSVYEGTEERLASKYPFAAIPDNPLSLSLSPARTLPLCPSSDDALRMTD